MKLEVKDGFRGMGAGGPTLGYGSGWTYFEVWEGWTYLEVWERWTYLGNILGKSINK